jgi:phosphatidylserine/phosphatidylglycerophosphate/cardiolipin synthase-like enzyme
MRRHPGRIGLALLLALCVAVGLWQTTKPMPPGTAVDSGDLPAASGSIGFLQDLTWAAPGGKQIHEQAIFDAVFSLVDEAATTLVVDFFLFNDQAGASGKAVRPLSRELADHLLARKRANPALQVVVLTDPINDVYGGAPSPLLVELRAAGIDVVVTDLRRLRDSNPGYSSAWRVFIQWWGNSPTSGWLPNPFAEGPSRISLRSWLALLNFKANHRKTLVADRADGTWAGLVTSANPHDASSGHSNVAFRFTGDLARAVLASELDIARFSGWSARIVLPAPKEEARQGTSQAAFVTEGRIRDRLLATLGKARSGDDIAMAMFYLSDRRIITALKQAAERGARVRLILDPNKDAFGIEKDGVPNRPVARELVEDTGGAIAVRWYRTTGEQFHAKWVLARLGDQVVASLGSANLTRRNLGNYNLEANIEVTLPGNDPLAIDMQDAFDRLWNNEGDTPFTTDFAAYRDESVLRYWRYRVMEATGLSTF